jgi:hypothetical protein
MPLESLLPASISMSDSTDSTSTSTLLGQSASVATSTNSDSVADSESESESPGSDLISPLYESFHENVDGLMKSSTLLSRQPQLLETLATASNSLRGALKCADRMYT